MRAIVIDDFGGPERLELREVPDPKVGPDSVLIRNAAAGVNPVDAKLRAGGLEALFPHRFPVVLGWDAAGMVEAIGPAVVGVAVGDPVYAYCRKTEVAEGTYAELVTVPEDVVSRRPEGISVAEAAALPLAGLTAMQGLSEGAQIAAGDTLLVEAAAGGVGHLVVQIAKRLGARVVGTASPDSHDFVRGLGADAVVDYHEDDLAGALRAAAPEGYAAAFDVFGGDGLTAAREALGPGGRIVSLADTDPAAGRSDLVGHYTFVRPSASGLANLARMVEEGAVRVHVSQTLPLEQTADAHRRLEEGHVRGKLVVEVGD